MADDDERPRVSLTLMGTSERSAALLWDRDEPTGWLSSTKYADLMANR